MTRKKEIAKHYTEENTIRLIAAQVVLWSAIAWRLESIIPAAVLLIDFAIRAFTFFPSPFAMITKELVKALNMKKQPVFITPKKFAALLGFIFSVTVLFLFLINEVFLAKTVLVVLAICALLESLFKICLGCYVYNWVIVPFSKK